jgi:hypothetical protein
VGLQRSEVSEFEVGSFFFFFKSDWFPTLIIRFANFKLFRVISYYQVFVLLPFLHVVFFFFFINFFKPPFWFVHFSEFIEHLISVFWDCCSHFLCFCVCWFVTAFVIYFVCLCVCVILLQFLQFLCVFDFLSIFVAIFEYIDFFQLLQFLCELICLIFCCKSYVCQFLSQFLLQFLCVLTFV